MTDNRTNEQIVADALRKVSTLGWNSRSIGVIEVVNALSNAGRLVAALGAAPQAESAPKSSYISPHLPAQIRGLYRADLREKSIQTMLDLAGDLIQELIDLRAAPALPSSGVDEEKLAEVIGKARTTSVRDSDGVKSVVMESNEQIARAVAEWLKGRGNAARE